MLSKSIIAEIDRLLREGQLSRRKIAAQLQVGRGTVSAIACGQRGLHGREPDEHEPDLYFRQSPPTRCPCCGYRVFLPCLVCRTRKYQTDRTAFESVRVA